MRKVLLYLLVIFMPVFMNAQENESKLPDKIKTVTLKLKDFEHKAGQYIGRSVEVTGIVDHVCKHGGKKMFLVDESSDARVKITTGDDMAAFTQNLVGETVRVRGMVVEQRVDEEYINEMEDKAASGISKKEGDGLHLKGEKENENNNASAQSDKAEKLKEELKKSGNDYISFFSIKATDFSIVDQK
jgi:hypothetical protein